MQCYQILYITHLSLMSASTPIHIFWFRRDLRLHDNAGLYHALRSGKPVLPIFIFDKNILDELHDAPGVPTLDKRVIFIHDALADMKQQLRAMGSDLHVYYGHPETIWKSILSDYPVAAVYTNRDYEPYAQQRDTDVKTLLQSGGIDFHTYKDHVIFEQGEVLKDNGEPYTVYTPYSKKWKEKFRSFYAKAYPTEKYYHNFYRTATPTPLIPLEEMGFQPADISFPATEISDSLIQHYPETRDFPAISGTSRMSVHLRFGTVSIRQLVRQSVAAHGEKFLNELIWRDFYSMILFHFPSVVSSSFRPEYDRIQWRNNEQEFKAWCEGKTGYPIVDAGMRELNATGYMHNRVRMIVASFLTKHLLIDWRWGEAYFAKKLLDFDLASNNGGWQWAAGTGVDAAPYFRVFNPYLQTLKFDGQLQYIRHWIPELDSLEYPAPIVDHDVARKRCLEVYKVGLGKD